MTVLFVLGLRGRAATFLMVKSSDLMVRVQRPSEGLLANLWEFPSVPVEVRLRPKTVWRPV